MANVLLLREPTVDAPDPYELAFKEAGYHPMSIPVLETIPCNISTLGNVIKDGPTLQGFSGVVITSRRSCDAWRVALQFLEKSLSNNEGVPGVAGWCTVPFYVVGQATATAMKTVFSEFRHLGLGLLDIRGQDTGSAASLAAFILQDTDLREKKLLYLVGDKYQDTMSRLLGPRGIVLEYLQTYMTQGSLTFTDKLTAALASLTEGSKNWWIIFFAPSAASFATPMLQQCFYLEEKTPSSTSRPSNLPRANVAAIGGTTDAFLRDELGLRVHAVPKKPTPQDIVAVLSSTTSLSTAEMQIKMNVSS
ncbi:hypothetical protein GALMADRAFT_153869 [Galerina marginata CBS 339.88]|uniref:Tetrapyrrole biosynthesis uroporphyrinogen III synthase domain-containing protein n=1 Tax=Galerina marginata (strain CBS 339.88) TaxID=685588 RepID=A0A067TAM5_GALM3|nr:hypothetical protein GALMADRAFT_153869 [Galerina marginata CBS 339.88]